VLVLKVVGMPFDWDLVVTDVTKVLTSYSATFNGSAAKQLLSKPLLGHRSSYEK